MKTKRFHVISNSRSNLINSFNFHIERSKKSNHVEIEDFMSAI